MHPYFMTFVFFAIKEDKYVAAEIICMAWYQVLRYIMVDLVRVGVSMKPATTP